ncbi:MAG: diguanylate cyclase [Vicinamibacterales bacterium]
MRLIGRNDLFLLLGLTVALVAIFSRPLARVLEYAREIEQSWGLQLVPGLVILAVAFVFHQARKRHEMRVEALASAAAAKQAAVRVERLVTFGQALSEALDHSAIGAAAAAHLPDVAEGRGVWAMALNGGVWHPLAVVADRSLTECELAARRALGDDVVGAEGVPSDVCFPMMVGRQPVGVLGVTDQAVTEQQRTVLAAAAALLAGALKTAELFEVVHENSVRDSLTGCFNRQHAMEILDVELRRARRSRLPLSLIILDLDHFKAINDRFGHLCGDAVLSTVGLRMQAVLRTSDVKCRYGGEEFLVLLPETPLSGAQRVAEVLRRDLEKHPVPWHKAGIHAADVRVTASFGLTMIMPGEENPTAIIARADAALYRAKEQGRNCVCVADPSEVIV